MSDILELIPNQDKKGKPFFQTEEEYQEFRKTFFEEVKDRLEHFREARQHWMR